MPRYNGCRLTVGIPVYNAMPYLREAVESLLAQSATEFKILAIVDGATDDSLSYLRSIHDSRLNIMVQQNAGLTATLNRMLREVKTPWLVRQDADDVSYKTRIERLLDLIDQHPNAGMFYSNAEYHPRSSTVGCFRSTRGTPEDLRRLVRSGYLLSICHPSVALNVDKVLAIGGYRSVIHVEDADLWWRMALAYEIQYIAEPLVGFRQNSGSVSSQNLSSQMLKVLYVQYLLLSHLEGYDPEPFERVESGLQELLCQRDFRAKEYLRDVNMSLARRSYGNASFSLIRAITTSPTYLFKRLKDEFLPGLVTNGVDPNLYSQRRSQFWPSVSNQINSVSIVP